MELDQKWNTWDKNQHPYGMVLWEVADLSPSYNLGPPSYFLIFFLKKSFTYWWEG